MHVLLITSSYKSCFNSVSALFFRDQAMALKNNGCQVGVVCPLPISFKTIWRKKSVRFTDEIYNDNGVKTFVGKFPSIPKMVGLRQALSFRMGKRLFKSYVNQNGLPNIIHVHTFWPGELAIWIKENYGIPYVVTEHSSGFLRNLHSSRVLEFSKKVFANSKANIGVSELFCELLSKKFKTIFNYIPNVVDTHFFSLLAKSTSNKDYIFLNIAHLNENKNQSGLIRAFANQFKGDLEYQLQIVGAGKEYNSLKHLISDLGLESQVYLLGQKSREEIRDIIQQASCFVLSSFHETFGVVLIEAMSCGLPVLSTKSGGPESIITSDQLGVLCELDELEKQLKLITKRSFDPDLIRNHVLNHFSQKAIANTLMKFYND